MNRVALLHWAELVDSYRVFPRVFLVGCFLWAVNISYTLLYWYMALPPASRGIEASGFASVVFVAVLGFLKLVYTTYSQNGRDWNQQPTSTTTTIAQTTTTPTAPPP